MDSFIGWLGRAPQGFLKKLQFIFSASLLALFWSVAAFSLLGFLDVLPPLEMYKVGKIDIDGPSFSAVGLLSELITGAMIEEGAFRFAPLFLYWFIYDEFSSSDSFLRGVVPVSILSSVVFGYIHGGWFTLPVQGVSGIIFSVVYLKFGGMQGKVILPFVASSITHFFYNGFIVFPILLLNTVLQ